MYRYLFYDIATRTLLDALPMESVRYGGDLCGVGTFAGAIPLYADDLPMVRVLSAVRPFRTKLLVERQGQPVWIGWINAEPAYDSASGTLGVQAEESLGYFAARFVPTRSYLGIDQYDIARDLITTAQQDPGGDMWIAVDPDVMSGTLRDRHYLATDQTPVLTALTQLSEVIGGFEFGVRTGYDPGGQPYELLTLADRLGHGQDDAALALNFDRWSGGNIESFNWADAGRPMRTRMWATSETDEGVQLALYAQRPDLIAAGYPLLEESGTFDRVSSVATLAQHAAGLLAARAGVSVTMTLTLRPESGIMFGDWVLGDEVLVRVADWRFPPGQGGSPGMEGYFRVVSYTVSVDDEGTETYQLTLADTLI